MAGSHHGGVKAAATNRKKYGKDFYKRIGALGGKAGHTGGFYVNRALARTAGAKGGRISRRGDKANVDSLIDWLESDQDGFVIPAEHRDHWLQRLLHNLRRR